MDSNTSSSVSYGAFSTSAASCPGARQVAGQRTRTQHMAAINRRISAATAGHSKWLRNQDAAGFGFPEEDGGGANADAIAAVRASEIVTLHPRIEVALVIRRLIELIWEPRSTSPFVPPSLA